LGLFIAHLGESGLLLAPIAIVLISFSHGLFIEILMASDKVNAYCEP
jgi:hypothetical protein